MTGQGIVPHLGITPNSARRESERTCWICFATETENLMATWLHPCQCRGSTKWVHESCLYRWIDEKQNGNSRAKVTCMQCQVEYIIIFPKVSRLAIILERFQDIVRHCSLFVAASAFLGSVYWTAVTYGGLTVIQVFGQQRGMEIMEKGDPFILLVGLPFIPVALILSRLIRWEDALLRLWHKRHEIADNLPLVKRLFNRPSNSSLRAGEPAPLSVPDEPVDFARIFCGGIMLPSIATIMGNIMYRNMTPPLYRTLLGGATFIGVKGILKIYLRQKQYLNKTRRHIVDYTEENVRIYMSDGQDESRESVRQIAGSEDNESDLGEDMENEVADADVDINPDATQTSDIDDSQFDDVRDHVIISVPDRPYTLFLS
ncbi:E3 ubiquitin-protein ligase MARCH5 [Drosophila hydei]|uniref:E3 ubiquitin-protein ligase MARCHF5 n=1 Tax=Drosophila hydei TaxID=7224 RepID=A0A6J1LUV5_DROHY|nr:E3 ubiquitin-protein ligase MARCH5 [Drosophila hydei]